MVSAHCAEVALLAQTTDVTAMIKRQATTCLAGTWYAVTASNISVACSHFNYDSSAYSQPQGWNQTLANDGGPLLNEQGKEMTINWTAQFDAADNATSAACESAIGDLVKACAGKNQDSEGGVYNYADNSAAYGVDFTTTWCDC